MAKRIWIGRFDIEDDVKLAKKKVISWDIIFSWIFLMCVIMSSASLSELVLPSPTLKKRKNFTGVIDVTLISVMTLDELDIS